MSAVNWTSLALFVGLAGAAPAQTIPDSWPEIAKALFPHAAIAEDDDFVSLQAPPRAEDAALTPITMVVHRPGSDARRVVKLSLVIDENPAPLAAEITLGPDADVTSLSTRVRVDAYTNMRLLAELSDGSLHMTKTYVKAAGGCSAPATKAMDEADVGRMKLRVIDDAAVNRGDFVVMLRHPNNSGLQMDQVTRLYTPARYVDHLAVYQGDRLVFSVEGGISISENPNFRFNFALNDAKTLKIEARDIDNAHFTQVFPLKPGA